MMTFVAMYQGTKMNYYVVFNKERSKSFRPAQVRGCAGGRSGIWVLALWDQIPQLKPNL